MKLRVFHHFFYAWLLCIFGCEKVIDLEVKDAKPQFVIDGSLTSRQAPWVVYVSKTKKLSDGEDFNGVRGAKVQISSEGGTEQLAEIGEGVYQSRPLAGTPGHTYKLTVIADDKVFTASSTMPEVADYTDLKFNKVATTAESTIVTAVYKDNVESTDFFWFERYINNIKLSGYDVYNDEFTGGQLVSKDFVFKNSLNNGSYTIKSGDRIRIDMNAVDANAYTYFFSLFNATGFALNGLAPSNPVGNISGGALGVFTAHSQKSKTIIVP